MNNIIHTTNKAAELRTLVGLFVAEVMHNNTDDILRLLKREELSLPRIAALHFVEKRGSASISEISGCLDLSLGNTSMLVDKLVCHGFVTRAEDAHDRRHKLVRLTEKGQAFIDELRLTRVDQVAQRLLLLSPDLIDRFVGVLDEVIAQLPHTGAEPSAAQLPAIVKLP
jgi:DNA-binding MarR family transcriptional regulator